MKKNIALMFTALCLLTNGCTSFLNVETLGKSTIGGFFSDLDGLRSAGIGLHYLMLDFVDDEYFFLADVAADNTNVKRVNAGLEETKIFDFTNLAEDIDKLELVNEEVLVFLSLLVVLALDYYLREEVPDDTARDRVERRHRRHQKFT